MQYTLLPAGGESAHNPFAKSDLTLKQQLIDCKGCRALKADELSTVMLPYTPLRDRNRRGCEVVLDHRNKLKEYSQVDHAMRCDHNLFIYCPMQ